VSSVPFFLSHHAKRKCQIKVLAEKAGTGFGSTASFGTLLKIDGFYIFQVRRLMTHLHTLITSLGQRGSEVSVDTMAAGGETPIDA